MTFIMDSRLEESSFFIEDWALCRVSLRRDKTYPWLYLVPRRDGVREIFDLSAADRAQLAEEIACAGAALQRLYSPAKINTAALGNMVPQLHVHVFARFADDPAWPNPVWAVQSPEIAYTEDEKNRAIQALSGLFAELGKGSGRT